MSVSEVKRTIIGFPLSDTDFTNWAGRWDSAILMQYFEKGVNGVQLFTDPLGYDDNLWFGVLRDLVNEPIPISSPHSNQIKQVLFAPAKTVVDEFLRLRNYGLVKDIPCPCVKLMEFTVYE